MINYQLIITTNQALQISQENACDDQMLIKHLTLISYIHTYTNAQTNERKNINILHTYIHKQTNERMRAICSADTNQEKHSQQIIPELFVDARVSVIDCELQ